MFLEIRGGGGGAEAPLVISRKINIFAYCPKRDHTNLQKKLFLWGRGVLCLLFPAGSCGDEEKTVTWTARQQTITDHMILKSLEGCTWKFQQNDIRYYVFTRLECRTELPETNVCPDNGEALSSCDATCKQSFSFVKSGSIADVTLLPPGILATPWGRSVRLTFSLWISNGGRSGTH